MTMFHSLPVGIDGRTLEVLAFTLTKLGSLVKFERNFALGVLGPIAGSPFAPS